MRKTSSEFVVVAFLALTCCVGVAAQDSKYDGCFVGAVNNNLGPDSGVNRTISGVTPVGPQTGSGTAQPSIIYVNGVLTTVKEQRDTMLSIANSSGQGVLGIHNATLGWGKDFGQTSFDLFALGRNPATQTLSSYIFDNLSFRDGDLHLIGHSQGTIIINNAVKEVKRLLERDGKSECEVLAQLGRLKIETYGSPIYDFVTGPSYYHSCNYSDALVCNFGGRRFAQDEVISLQKKYSDRGTSKAEAEVYGGNAVVDNFNSHTLIHPIDSHSIDEVYLQRRPRARFQPPPSCYPILFLMDTSGSMADAGKWDGALQSALGSLKDFEGDTEVRSTFYPTAVLSFAGECSENSSHKLFSFTTDVAQVSKDLPSRLPRPNGGTPLFISYDVAWKVLDEFSQKNPHVNLGSMIILTDGEDTCGASIRPSGSYGAGNGQGGTMSFMKKGPKNTRVFAIGYDISPGSRGERDLQYMAFAGGGKYYNAANPKQLKRAFQKLTQSYAPRHIILTDALLGQFGEKVRAAATALQRKDMVEALKLYRQLEGDFNKAGVKSAELNFNLAQTLEANDLYRGAADYYQRYLQANPGAVDKAIVDRRILQLREDYRDQFDYYLKSIESDLTYLKAYYKDLFNKRNDALAAEFAGFVSEKGLFYTNLSNILEVKAKWLDNGAKDLSDSLYNLSDRVNKPSFDRDAVSLLTLPISQLEELLEQLNQNKSKLIN